jgi:hypothetical protein
MAGLSFGACGILRRIEAESLPIDIYHPTLKGGGSGVIIYFSGNACQRFTFDVRYYIINIGKTSASG